MEPIEKIKTITVKPAVLASLGERLHWFKGKPRINARPLTHVAKRFHFGKETPRQTVRQKGMFRGEAYALTWSNPGDMIRSYVRQSITIVKAIWVPQDGRLLAAFGRLGHLQRDDSHLTHPHVGNRTNIPPFQGANPHVGNCTNIPPHQGATPHVGNHSNNLPLPVRLDYGIPNGNPRITMFEEQLQQLLNNNKMKEYKSDEEIEPFMPYVLALPYPPEFEMPTTTKYDGTTDPRIHISDFNTLIQAHLVVGDWKCVLFPTTLSGAASSWFKMFKRHCIVS
uniref:Retrotransposon gag domain-containing protein n=1 Tax=Cannabis sativa TaxID=3483 RepID=A0A803Q253_CANSA